MPTCYCLTFMCGQPCLPIFHFSVLSKFCIMNTLLHFLLLCQSCRSLRNVGLSFGGRILGLIKSAYHGWLSMMTSSEAPPFWSCLRPPNLKATTVLWLCHRVDQCFSNIFMLRNINTFWIWLRHTYFMKSKVFAAQQRCLQHFLSASLLFCGHWFKTGFWPLCKSSWDPGTCTVIWAYFLYKSSKGLCQQYDKAYARVKIFRVFSILGDTFISVAVHCGVDTNEVSQLLLPASYCVFVSRRAEQLNFQ